MFSAGHDSLLFRSYSCPSTCWPKSLDNFIFFSSLRSFEWSFLVSRIPLDNCTRPLAVCEICDVLSPTKLLLSAPCSYVLHSVFLLNLLSLEVLTQKKKKKIVRVDLSRALCSVTNPCSSFSVSVHISLAYKITGQTVPLKILTRWIFSSFILSASFIVINTFHADLIILIYS